MMFNTFAYSGSWDEPELIFSAMRWHPNLTNILICFVRAVNTSMQITWASVMCHRCNSHSLEWLQYIIRWVLMRRQLNTHKLESWNCHNEAGWAASQTTLQLLYELFTTRLIASDMLDRSQKPIRHILSVRLSSESSIMELRHKSVALESGLKLWAWTNH